MRSHHVPPVPTATFPCLFMFSLQGSPCLVGSVMNADGVGSMTMRHLMTQMYAEEVGCDWLTPEWGAPMVGDGSGASLYCHSAATYDEQRRWSNNNNNDTTTTNSNKAITQDEWTPVVRRCSLTNWLEFFNFKMSSVEPPVNCTYRVVEVRLHSNRRCMRTKGGIIYSTHPWTRLVFMVNFVQDEEHTKANRCLLFRNLSTIRTCRFQPRTITFFGTDAFVG